MGGSKEENGLDVTAHVAIDQQRVNIVILIY